MIASATTQAIQEFWHWFSLREESIRQALDASSFAALEDEVAEHVRALGPGLGWEVGPGIQSEYAFVVSPNGIAAQLEITDRIVSYAPLVPNWEFYSAKPPKQWDMRFEMQDDVGRVVEIDASKWQYSLTAYNNREFFDVLLVVDEQLKRINERGRRLAGYILLEGILGERAALERVGAVMVRFEAEVEKRDSLSEVSVLSKHFKSLIESA